MKEEKVRDEKYKKIKELVMKYSYLGTEYDKVNGGLLIGPAPHIAPHAWLNELFPPLNELEFIELKKDIRIYIPDEFKYFLKNFSNGLGIICRTLNIYGKRKNYVRDLANAHQPFSILDTNVYERPNNATDDMLFIGGYEYDASNL